MVKDQDNNWNRQELVLMPYSVMAAQEKVAYERSRVDELALGGALKVFTKFTATLKCGAVLMSSPEHPRKFLEPQSGKICRSAVAKIRALLI
jgi:hypothetical protein